MAKNWKKAIESSFPKHWVEDENPIDADAVDEEGVNPYAKRAFLEIADNQIRDLEPATKAYERMISEGISDAEARRLIANLAVRATYNVLKG